MGSRQGYNPNEMERSKFEALVAQALDGLPKTFREKLTNVAIIVEDRPPQEPDGGLLLGLFHGIPRTEKSVFFSSPPDRIFLYQRNVEAVCTSEAEVSRQIRETLLHEVGHLFWPPGRRTTRSMKTVRRAITQNSRTAIKQDYWQRLSWDLGNHVQVAHRHG